TIAGPSGNGAILDGSVPVTGWSKFISPAIKRRLSPAAASAVYSALLPSGNLGAFSRRGGAEPGTTFQNLPAELLMNGAPMSLARFPATGWLRAASVAGDGVTVTLPSARRVAASNDAWVQGFWSTEWWQTWEPMTGAPSRTTVQVAGLTSGSPLGPVANGARLAIVNSLEDLNQPGQYYVDRPNSRVYFYPTSSINGSFMTMTQLDGYIIDAYQTNNLTLKNLLIQGSRGQGVQLYGCTNSGLNGCMVRSTQLEGVVISSGSGNFVKNSVIQDTGSCGIMANEGNVASLTVGGDQFVNNTLLNPGRVENTDRPAIWIRGVGSTVSWNTITNCPGQAIMIDGCYHLVMQNDISHTGQTMNDVGAVYSGQNIFNRGNVVSQNIIHDIPPVIFPQSGNPLSVGVYLDDFGSGYSIQDNIFYNVSTGVLIGGGRSNNVGGNAFCSVQTPVWIDARGTNWAASFFAPGGRYQQQLAAASPAQMNLFESVFPDFLSMVTASNPALPQGNVVSNPYFPSAGIGVLYLDATAQQLLQVLSPLYNGNAIFVSPSTGNFSLVPGAQVSTYLPNGAGSSGAGAAARA
ncbi:MAG TPA: right-handed parallel beta-helix repeat-containing protein, partial [Fimbriimonadaceae bacterium]|nr:right-handed parallel beta-helix repeat-containing protein [Fimbriimonadaceae bacterium]